MNIVYIRRERVKTPQSIPAVRESLEFEIYYLNTKTY